VQVSQALLEEIQPPAHSDEGLALAIMANLTVVQRSGGMLNQVSL